MTCREPPKLGLRNEDKQKRTSSHILVIERGKPGEKWNEEKDAKYTRVYNTKTFNIVAGVALTRSVGYDRPKQN